MVYALAKRRFGRAVEIEYKPVKLSTGVKVFRKSRGKKVDQVFPAIFVWRSTQLATQGSLGSGGL